MIDKVKDKTMTYICNKCKTKREIDLNGYKMKFNEEFQQYENLTLGPCPECGNTAVINLNVSLEELDTEFIEKEKVPNKEINNRKYIDDIKLMQ